MKFGHSKKIETAKTNVILSGLIFNKMIETPAFWGGIPKDKVFSNTNLSCEEVTKIIRVFLTSNYGIKVSFYYSNYFQRNVVAYVNSGRYMTLNFNTRFHDFVIKRSESPVNDLADKLCTLSHETIHIVDNYSDQSFGHGSNSSVGKGDTVPYWFGDYCKKYFLENFGEFQNISIYDYLFINN
jgi:hypothetical protein